MMHSNELFKVISQLYKLSILNKIKVKSLT